MYPTVGAVGCQEPIEAPVLYVADFRLLQDNWYGWLIMTLAPIVLFVYARPMHTQRTLAALAVNALADQSDLIIYADGARGKQDADAVMAVRAIARAATGFRSVSLVERTANYGLACNIIEGVSETLRAHDRVIVLEDDIVTSPAFLTFMNEALVRYKEDACAWHISGWNYPIEPSGLEEAFFWRVMNCWGWATWSDRWLHFRKDARRLVETWDEQTIHRFNLDGAHDFWAQVTANHNGAINTWAIFWYATVFENHGLCLNPARSFVENIGLDNTGENCIKDNDFYTRLSNHEVELFPPCFTESECATNRIAKFYKAKIRPGSV